MKNLEIGIVTISYNNKGKLTSGAFKPTMEVTLPEDIREEIKAITAYTDKEVLKANADITMASWFSTVNEIELNDRDNWAVESEIITCEKWPSGQIKKCVLRYVFKEINLETA